VADRSVDYLLIGGGIAAGNCAKTLREEGADGTILLVGREPDPPYDRPPLSKGYLRGDSGREDALLEPAGWYERNGVELLTRTSVMKLDPGERVAKLSTREEVAFDKALIATGANVRRLRVDGTDLDGIHYLRAFGNADAIRADAEAAGRVVLVGGSYIGCEVAATLTSKGIDCAIVMQEDVTLERAFGPEVGRHFQSLLEERGIEVHGGDELERFEGSDGRVGKVVTKRGLELECGCAVLGCGVAPDTMLAKAAGLDLGENGGVRVSETLETSVPGIFAAGDVAEYDSPIHGRPMRIEHWDVAGEHGKTAARNMLGHGKPHDVVPYFFSDLADWAALEYVGPGSGDPVLRGSFDDGEFTVFYLDDGKVTAALTVGRSGDLDHARRMIKEGAAPPADALADPDTDLASLQ
jgi:3-phenylpropionate/trans-cinnamate dioxygenase ferredoxin reductase component